MPTMEYDGELEELLQEISKNLKNIANIKNVIIYLSLIHI